MAEIITVVSGKGGVGKSTFCANIALTLAEKGKTILLIDGDVGLRSLDLLLSVENQVIYDWSDIVEGRCDKEKAVISCNNNLHLLPAPLEEPEELTKEVFENMLGNFRVEYDYVFIDAPAGIGSLPKIYAQCSDKCIVVATADEVSARSAGIAGNELVKIGVKDENLRLIINRFSHKAVRRGKLLNFDDMIDRTSIRLLGVVPEDNKLTYASVTEKPISEFSDTKIAFTNISDRILGKETPIYL